MKRGTLMPATELRAGLPGLLRRIAFVGALLVLALPALISIKAVQAAELVMFETEGCVWCEAWNREVGGIYHKTEEGRVAPLRRVELHGPRPADLGDVEGIVYTPTFVLTEGGREVGRINGYPGNEHFWGLLGVLVKKLPPLTEPRPANLGIYANRAKGGSRP